MLSFDEFKRSGLCKQLILAEEDTPQDAVEWRRLLQDDQKRQYDEYLMGMGEKLAEVGEKVITGAQVKFDRNEYHRRYMRKYMKMRRAVEKLEK